MRTVYVRGAYVLQPTAVIFTLTLLLSEREAVKTWEDKKPALFRTFWSTGQKNLFHIILVLGWLWAAVKLPKTFH